MTYVQICNEFFKDFHEWHDKNSVGCTPVPEALDWGKFNNMTEELVRVEYGFNDIQYKMIVDKIGKFNYIECYMTFVDRVVQYCEFLKLFNICGLTKCRNVAKNGW